MSSLIQGTRFIQETLRMCFGFMFVSLSFAAHTAQPEEGSLAPHTHVITNKLVSETGWAPSYRLNTNVALTHSEDVASTDIKSRNTLRLSSGSKPKNELLNKTAPQPQPNIPAQRARSNVPLFSASSEMKFSNKDIKAAAKSLHKAIDVMNAKSDDQYKKITQ